MNIEALIEAKSEFTDSANPPEPIVMMTRIRLARNLMNFSFPDWAKPQKRAEILNMCKEAVKTVPELKDATIFESEKLKDLDKQVLVERHLISPEFAQETEGAGVIISKDQSIAIMINEEDHLRIQVIRCGFIFDPVWKLIDKIDGALEERLPYVFSDELGYLTACPTNLGTAMRGSLMVHLPGLVLTEQIDKIIRAANQLGLAVRGIYGEGSEANGSFFQISNQQTLGETESDILKRLKAVLETVVSHEKNARLKLLQMNPTRLFDKIGRAYGIAKYGFSINAFEAMNLLSLIRLGIDLGVFAEKHRRMVDKLFLEIQPGHLQVLFNEALKPEERDDLRAYFLREKFKNISKPNFQVINS